MSTGAKHCMIWIERGSGHVGLLPTEISGNQLPKGSQTVQIIPLQSLAAGTYLVVTYERATKRTFNLTVL
jgi:hypothetical protein